MSRSGTKSQVVVVTGASGGIGAACVNAFLQTGACVVRADLRLPDEQGTTDLTEGDSRFIATDIRDDFSVRNLFTQTRQEFGRIDVLVNNAAVLVPAKPVHETTLEEFDSLIATNLRGTFLCCKHAYEHLCPAQGCIINLSSMAGERGEKYHAVYAATKGAINALTRAMAIDYGREGIRVNAVCPAGVRTNNAQNVIETSPDAESILKLRDSLHALGYTASAGQVASAVVFLASSAASFITGALLPVSGGAELGYGVKY